MAIEVLELQVRTTGTQQSASQFDQLSRSVSATRSALGFLRNALVVFSAVRAFSGIVGLIDSFTEITTKLKLVTNNTEELTAVTQKLFEVSQQTRTSFDANVTLFNRVARATTSLHLNYLQLINSTRTVAELVKISGATSAEATGGLIQFSQALASNRLSGDELRTVLEQLPRLADVIGKEFGVSGAALRGLANSNPGIITTEKIMRAIANAAADTDTEFKKTVPTIADGFTLITNALELFIGRLNQAGGVGAFLFDLLAKIAQNIDLVVTALLALAALGTFNFLANQALGFAANVGRAGGVVLGLLNFMTGSVGTLIRAFVVLGITVANIFAGNTLAGGSAIISFLTLVGNIAKQSAIAIGTFAIAFVRSMIGVTASTIAATVSLVRFLAVAVALGSLSAAARLAQFSASLATGAAIMARLVVAGGSLIGVFANLGTVLTTAAGAMLRLGLATLANPLFLGAAIVLGVVVGLFFLLRDRVEKLIESFGGLRNVVNNTFAFIQTSVQVLFTSFDLLWKAVQEQAFNAFESVKGVILGALDTISGAIKTISLGQVDLGLFNFKPAESEFAGSAEKLANVFNEKFQENLAADPLKRVQESASDAFKFIRGLTTGQGINEGALLGKPPGAGGAAPDNQKANKIASLTQQIENFISRVDPFFDVNAKIDKMRTLFIAAGKAGVDVAGILARAGLTQADVFKLIEREELGVGNATHSYESRINLLDSAVARHIITEKEFGEAIRKNRIEFLEAQRDISSGIELALKKIEDSQANQTAIAAEVITNALSSKTALETLTIQTDALAQARAKGVLSEEQYAVALRQTRDAALEQQRDAQSGITLALDAIQEKVTNQKDIAKQVVTDALAESTALKTLEAQTIALKAAVDSGAISNEQYDKTLRDLRITALDAQTDTASGFERGLLKAQRDLADTAKLSEKVITDMFSGMTDALVGFFKTGKLSLHDLVDSIETDLLKLAVTQSITGPLANFLGLSGGATGGAGGLLGGGANASIAPTGGGSGLFGGVGSFLFGSGGGTSGLGSLLGFANEGSFRVGGTGGTDSQLVAFRASPDENVSIEKPGRGRPAQENHTKVEIHVHGVTDADSFRRAEDQIYTRAGQKINRTLARNG